MADENGHESTRTRPINILVFLMEIKTSGGTGNA